MMGPCLSSRGLYTPRSLCPSRPALTLLSSQAPGYSRIITNPMDFTTIRQKLASDMYLTWDALEADLVLMFTNCMTINPTGE